MTSHQSVSHNGEPLSLGAEHGVAGWARAPPRVKPGGARGGAGQGDRVYEQGDQMYYFRRIVLLSRGGASTAPLGGERGADQCTNALMDSHGDLSSRFGYYSRWRNLPGAIKNECSYIINVLRHYICLRMNIYYIVR